MCKILSTRECQTSWVLYNTILEIEDLWIQNDLTQIFLCEGNYAPWACSTLNSSVVRAIISSDELLQYAYRSWNTRFTLAMYKTRFIDSISFFLHFAEQNERRGNELLHLVPDGLLVSGKNLLG